MPLVFDSQLFLVYFQLVLLFELNISLQDSAQNFEASFLKKWGSAHCVDFDNILNDCEWYVNQTYAKLRIRAGKDQIERVLYSIVKYMDDVQLS